MTQEFSDRKGSLLGGCLMVAGCCIGAGMLGLPVVTAAAGFVPSVLMFGAAWAFMACTGLLLLEVNLYFTDEVSIITMARYTLGRLGKAISWGTYLFLFYSLIIAYVAGSGGLLVDFYEDFTGGNLSPSLANVVSGCVFGAFIIFGTAAVDKFNRLLMFGLIASYAFLLTLGAHHVNFSLLRHRDWGAAVWIAPILITSFGFHNLVPSLTTYLAKDKQRLRIAILVGSACPLLVYLLWEGLILGIVPLNGETGLMAASDDGAMATQALRNVVGSPLVLELAESFSFFAIVTSLLTVALSFLDFLADGLKVRKTLNGKVFLTGLVMAPPMVFAMVNPSIFLTALGYAGSFGAMTLFGILPALMVWKGRYRLIQETEPLVPGGKITLVVVLAISTAVIVMQLGRVL